jgi:WhiB family transcriptional regulator, redox-sensing transcriptional regulator
MPEDVRWMERAACRGQPVELFFPPPGPTSARVRALCSSCAVREECLDYATADEELAGIWAGTSERERRRLRRAA